MSRLPTKTNAAAQHIQSLITQAEQLFEANNIDEALALLAEAESKHSDQPNFPYLVGKFTARKKSVKDGIEKLEATLEQFPTHLNTILELGDIYLKPGNVKKAAQYFHLALETAPLNPSVQAALGALNQRKADLPRAVDYYRKAIELQLKNPITEKPHISKEDFKIHEAEALLWETLGLLTENGIHVFMAFGSLLGIVRNGELLLHDKDVDVGLPYSEMQRAVRILEKNGWKEANNSFGYISPRALVHQESGFSLDLFGFMIDEETKHATCLGIVIADTPKDWNILWDFDHIELEKGKTPDGKHHVWHLKNPEHWLETIYGDWRTPDKHFDTLLAAKNLRSFSLLTKCFAYSRIFGHWTANNIPKALAATRVVLSYEPNDTLIKKVLSRLESRRK
ncbi:tetratricopeptide (TPR) repeat protein [Paenalcaligenes hominis]|uniref:Tetratricopeptide (TPR) repeat protein n=1 Tax=Paenalcaligenes hominis TaxID=643674 RepID=A0ABX0WT31_9BURK|nr:tetratricopeptide repeat protein [Paenalcaligenes hominis]NJB65928.1 tetratricopeptide (TPR) repeat protein [Paenalcaligenes hominis]GGE70777.1 hypothetical protein GCM10007278_18650 [Paenalcaligenes hominis]